MNILLVYGSPHKHGTTHCLAEAFLAGVDQRAHTIDTVWLGEKKVAPCVGCEYCRSHDGSCVHGDDMTQLLPKVLEADLVVFVSPIYYFGFSAQMKAFIDRFYAVNAQLRSQTEKKAILLCAGGGKEEWIPDGILANYHTMLRYLHWESLGNVCALSCHGKEQLAQTVYLQEARKLGESL